MSNIATKLAALRKQMEQHHLDFYFVPARDAHNNEYVPACWQRRAWISDFTGSAGDALIGLDKAYLWTDSRYFLQAEQQLDGAHYTLQKQMQGTPPLEQWFLQNAKNKICGVDPRVISIAQAEQWRATLERVQGKLESLDLNLIDEIWKDRPALPQNPIFQYPLKHAGLSTPDKLRELRETLAKKNARAHVLSQLDAIAWLFNLRGTDVEYNPLAICYAIISSEEAVLFIDPAKVPAAEQTYLASQKIIVKPYDAFAAALHALTGKIWIDPQSASGWVAQQLKQASLLLEVSPVLMMKSRKNCIELEGMREAHRRDALAMVKFLHWLDNNWRSGMTEISASDQLEKFRREDSECRDLSFTTISGFASNGAIVHYRAEPKTNRRIDDSNLYLIDSGGQYFYGTTDITRTLHLGSPTEEQKRHYTLVLKGHLDLRHTIFPAGTCGEHLDAIARHPLWQAGLNYGHGTGHGVGCYLCVHEGPQRIAPGHSRVPLEPGMIVSNEPGVYFPGQYGIRIENLCSIVEVIPHSDSGPNDGPFYGFEDLTQVPYARNLIAAELLSAEEIGWVDDYHRSIYELLIDDLNDDQRTWLASATAPLD